MNYRERDRQFNLAPKKRKDGFGVFQVAVIVIIVAVIWLVLRFFGGSIADMYYGLKYSLLGTSGPVVTGNTDNALLIAFETENDQLKELLGRGGNKQKFTIAAVLVRPPQTPYDSIVIDVGSTMGLSVGDIVYAEMDYAIGKVASVSGTHAVITLFSSSGQKEDVLVGSSTTAVLAEGRGGGNFYIKMPRNIVVKPGDPIVWPDIGTILLGVVSVVDSGNGEAYANVYFKSPVNIQSLRYVQFKTNTR